MSEETLKSMGIKKTKLKKHGGLVDVWELDDIFFTSKEAAVQHYKKKKGKWGLKELGGFDFGDNEFFK